MFSTLPENPLDFLDWSWPQIEPFYQDLLARHLDSSTLPAWLADWTRLKDLVDEAYARWKVAFDRNTADTQAEARYHAFLDSIHPAAQARDQQLKEKLLASGLEPENFSVPLLKLRTEADLYRPENLSLLSEERKLATQYDKLVGAQTVAWEGVDRTVQAMRMVLQTPDRLQRQRAWELTAARQLGDRSAINTLWIQLLDVRRRLAENAALPDFRAYRWRQLLRLDYAPQDCFRFNQAIEEVVVPAATRLYKMHRQRFGVKSLRPWDLDQDLYPINLPPLPRYGSVSDLEQLGEGVFRRVDPQFGAYFRTMLSENLLDLANRKGKAPGAYAIGFPASRRPFILMNAVGLASDVRSLLHEAGHAFHNFERMDHLPYAQQRTPGLEFAEVASMAMELLASSYLSKKEGGFYTEADADRFLAGQLEHILFFWPYMAVVDSFQHWVYTHLEEAANPAACDACWLALWRRYLPGVDWSHLEAEAMSGWQRKQHIFRYPFYYFEYGLAQLGAVQVWRNARQDQSGAVAAYRRALALGGTASLPDLYAAAGARLAFDAGALAEAVALIDEQLME